jgi:hypothetical protein
MRPLCVAVLSACLAGCNVETNKSSETSVTNPDGSTTVTKTKTWSKNGVSGGEKSETTLGGGKQPSIVNYELKNGDWVKK